MPATLSLPPVPSAQIDLDTIETSNLNRQFLFRKHHVGMSKARVAAEVVASLKPEATIVPHHANIKVVVVGGGCRGVVRLLTPHPSFLSLSARRLPPPAMILTTHPPALMPKLLSCPPLPPSPHRSHSSTLIFSSNLTWVRQSPAVPLMLPHG